MARFWLRVHVARSLAAKTVCDKTVVATERNHTRALPGSPGISRHQWRPSQGIMMLARSRAKHGCHKGGSCERPGRAVPGMSPPAPNLPASALLPHPHTTHPGRHSVWCWAREQRHPPPSRHPTPRTHPARVCQRTCGSVYLPTSSCRLQVAEAQSLRPTGQLCRCVCAFSGPRTRLGSVYSFIERQV